MNASNIFLPVDRRAGSIPHPNNMHRFPQLVLIPSALSLFLASFARCATSPPEIPEPLQIVLGNTRPLEQPRQGRLPLYVLPISDSLKGLPDDLSLRVLKELEARGIGYTTDWRPSELDESLSEGLRIARLQQAIGQPIAVNATSCLQSFYDNTPQTMHIDDSHQPFADPSFGTPLGCPFALDHRIPVIRRQVEAFVKEYKRVGVALDFVFADWEIDGPIEWNDAWPASQRCTRCRAALGFSQDFRKFQSQLRSIRCRLQRESFASTITDSFPQALVGNYAVYPHNGHRYWYDYFEKPASDTSPFRADQKARYREWYHEFPETKYTMAMPVIYTWYPIFDWYDYAVLDYRWIYNLLLNGSSAAQSTPSTIPLIPFVHRHTTAPPEKPNPDVVPLSEPAYEDLLWHLLLRGHDSFFVWCLPEELADEVRIAHRVYADSHPYLRFLQNGTPIDYSVPTKPGRVTSGLSWGGHVLVRTSNYRSDHPPQDQATYQIAVDSGNAISIPTQPGTHVVKSHPLTQGFHVQRGEELLFPLGFYELPKGDKDLRELAQSGINLVRCESRQDLDRVHAMGLAGWMTVPVQQGATSELRERVNSVVDHPALAIWEGPDEIVWTFTAFSGLKHSAGISKDDWYEQRPHAVKFSESQATQVIPAMRAGIDLVRSLDPQRRPFWMNEAADSDLRFTRGYAGHVDLLGCDYYPVRGGDYDLRSIGKMVDRWSLVGRGKPVWMVLQAFSWHTMFPERGRHYPDFTESRFMAYSALVHGAEGLLYWGSTEIDDPAFRKSIYALTSELNALQPFLSTSKTPTPRIALVKDLFEDVSQYGVKGQMWRSGENWLLVLVNEDAHRHLGVDVQGLDALESRQLYELYGPDTVSVEQGAIAIRMQPFDVKVYCTSRQFQTENRQGRDYISP